MASTCCHVRGCEGGSSVCISTLRMIWSLLVCTSNAKTPFVHTVVLTLNEAFYISSVYSGWCCFRPVFLCWEASWGYSLTLWCKCFIKSAICWMPESPFLSFSLCWRHIYNNPIKHCPRIQSEELNVINVTWQVYNNNHV